MKSIYNIEPKYEVDESLGKCTVFLYYNGKAYRGCATVKQEDRDFFSEKVGLNIALHRARIELLKDILLDTIKNIKAMTQMYQAATKFNKEESMTIDPTGRFKDIIIRFEKKEKKIRAMLKQEKTSLRKYFHAL